MIQIRSGNTVYNEVKRPTVVFDREVWVLLKIGEYEVMREYCSEKRKKYTSIGRLDVANGIELLELPQDQELVDKIFQNSGYLRVYYNKTVRV